MDKKIFEELETSIQEFYLERFLAELAELSKKYGFAIGKSPYSGSFPIYSIDNGKTVCDKVMFYPPDGSYFSWED